MRIHYYTHFNDYRTKLNRCGVSGDRMIWVGGWARAVGVRGGCVFGHGKLQLPKLTPHTHNPRPTLCTPRTLHVQRNGRHEPHTYTVCCIPQHRQCPK
jgi:hypothetical protein